MEINSGFKGLMSPSYTLIRIYLNTYVTKDSLFVNKVIFSEYKLGRYNVYSVKGLLNFGEHSCHRYDAWYQLPSTKSHGVSSQEATDFTNTTVESSRINNGKGKCILRLNSENFRHFKQKLSELFSEMLWPSFSSHVIRSYYVNRRKVAPPPVSRNTLIYAQIKSHNLLACRIGLHCLILLHAEVSRLVELILLYQNWGYVF